MSAKIRIDVRQMIGRVSPLIYGQFLEHIGRAIYGGVYEPGNPLSDKDGFRLDVLDKIRELQAPILRWPGGNFSSAYHWQDGVGPRSERPKRMELAWQTTESNQFGTHEFIELCRRIKTEPYLAVNLGWGTPEEAVNWLEYCNADTDTAYAALRRRNGSAAPFGVKYWGLGNEVYGTWQHGHCEPEEYAHKASETAKMMKKLDGGTRFVFCGANNADWDFRVLDYLYRKGYPAWGIVDYLSLHRYDASETYYGMLAHPMDFEDDIRGLKAVLETIARKHGQRRMPMIAVDEWNVWSRKTAERNIAAKYFRKGEDLIEEFYNLRDALYFGCVLNVFIRHANRVGMANVAQTVNVIAPIIATPKGSYCQPTFFPLKYYRQMHQDLAMDVNVETEMLGLTPELERAEHERYRGECPPHWSTDPNVWPAASVSPWPRHWVDRPLPLIDASATRSEDGRTVTVSVVNRHREQPQAVELDLFDFQPRSGRRVVISGPDPMGYSLEAIGSDLADVAYHPEACAATESVMERVPSRFTLEVPAHSIALVTLTA